MKNARISRHLRACSIFLLLTASAAEFSGSAATVDALTPTGSMQMPFTLDHDTYAVWSGGSLVFVQDRFSSAPNFRFFDRNGTEVSQFTFSIPGVSRINIYDNSVALGLDGSLAITGTTNDDPGMFVAWVSPDRQEQKIMRTSPFFPHTVTIASDETIWVAGDDTKQPHEQSDFSQFLIRRYDKTGKLLGSFITWSSVGTNPPFPPTVRSVLVSFKDRVGWYSPDSHTYIEFSSDGSVVNRLASAPHPKHDLTYVAACDDDGLFATTQIIASDGHQSSWGIFTLDRQRGEWTLLPRNERWGMLFGCDGTRLATATDFNTISWLEPTPHRHAIELTLKRDLRTMRESIDQFTLDKQQSPQTLQELVDGGYLREIPIDPLTGKRDWMLVFRDPACRRESLFLPDKNLTATGIDDVHSSSRKLGGNRVPCSDW